MATATKSGTAKPAKAATPWGAATLVEEVTLPQRAGERRFASLVQLLENEKGERLVRFTYATGGTARRGPVTALDRASIRSRAVSTSEARTSAPSPEPSSGSMACSGCGIRPSTLPSVLHTPATSEIDPFGLSSS
jgi:hypothetical protein